MVSPELVQQLKEILLKEYALALTDQAVAELAQSLVALFGLLLKD